MRMFSSLYLRNVLVIMVTCELISELKKREKVHFINRFYKLYRCLGIVITSMSDAMVACCSVVF